MYESPINIAIESTTTNVVKKQDETIYQAIQKVGVNVNKDELIRALQYDRNQYDKGYKDGAKEFAKDLQNEIKRALTNNYDVKAKRLERLIEKGVPYNDDFINIVDGKIQALCGIEDYINELLNEWGGENNTTNN